jgi:hypothetical protein
MAHEELNISEIYSKLRMAHSLVKDVLYMDGFEKLDEGQKNAIESVSGVLYLAEGKFTDF